MVRTIRLSRAIVVILFLSVTAAGQTPNSNWDSVKMIAPGTEVRVAAGTSKPVRGKLENVTDADLTIQAETGTQSFPRMEIREVSIKKKGHRVRNTFIGMGVGTASGLGIGGAIAAGCNGFLCELAVPVYGAIGLIAGTVTGLVLPSGGWRRVYVA